MSFGVTFFWEFWYTDAIFSDKTIKLWKVTERDKRPEGYNLKDESGLMRDPTNLTSLRVPSFKPMELMVEASPRRIFANAHTYHINSISVNSDQETYLSADDLRINLWHLEVTDQSFSILKFRDFDSNFLEFYFTVSLPSIFLFNKSARKKFLQFNGKSCSDVKKYIFFP